MAVFFNKEPLANKENELKPDENLVQKISDSYERFILEHFGSAMPIMDAETAAQLTDSTLFVLTAKVANLVGSSCNRDDFPNMVKLMGVQFELCLAKFLLCIAEELVKEQSEGVH